MKRHGAPGRPRPDDHERVRRDDAGADESGRRGGRDRRRRDGEVGLLLGQAVLRRGRRQRPGDHRSRCGPRRTRPRRSSTGASFDNGIICSHEQFVLTPEERYEDTVKAFLATGKVWFTDDKEQVQKLREVVFPDGHLNKDVVGSRRRRSGRRRASTSPRGAGHPRAGRRVGDGGHPGQGEALPGGRDLPLRHVRRSGRAGEGQPAGGRGRALGGGALEQRRRTSAAWAWSCRSAVWSSTKPPL